MGFSDLLMVLQARSLDLHRLGLNSDGFSDLLMVLQARGLDLHRSGLNYRVVEQPIPIISGPKCQNRLFRPERVAESDPLQA